MGMKRGEVVIIPSFVNTLCTSSAKPLQFHSSFSFQQSVVMTDCMLILYKQIYICDSQMKRNPNLHNTKV